MRRRLFTLVSSLVAASWAPVLLTAILLTTSCAPLRRGRLPAANLASNRNTTVATKTGSAEVTAAKSTHHKAAKPSTPVPPKADIVCKEALSHLGTRYVYGGATPRGFDCSGLVQYCYKKVGINLPRRAIDQSRCGRGIRLSQARRGDLIFFDIKRGRISHVGIYLGEGKFIHAPNAKRVVEVKSLGKGSWYRKKVKRVRRVLPG